MTLHNNHLTQVTTMALPNNDQMGPIPTEFSQLTKPAMIGLHNNHLMGPIQPFDENDFA